MTARRSSSWLARVQPVDLAAITLIGGSLLVGILAAPQLPAQLQVHWTAGAGPYYGIGELPKTVGLAVIPLVAAVMHGVLRGITLFEDVRRALADLRWVYDVVLVATLLLLLGTQLLVIGLNLA